MRQNQLLTICLKDVNLDEGWINLSVESAKNHKEYRVQITRQLRPELTYLWQTAVGIGEKADDQFFNVHRFDGTFSRHKTMDFQPMRAFFRRLSRECCSVISPHRFRHTIATNMMKSSDHNLKIVQTLLGHSSIAVTLEYAEGNIDSVRLALEEAFANSLET